MACTLSLADLVVASFTSGPGASTLPMVVVLATRLGVMSEIYAPVTVTVIVVGVGVVIVSWAARSDPR